MQLTKQLLNCMDQQRNKKFISKQRKVSVVYAVHSNNTNICEYLLAKSLAFTFQQISNKKLREHIV